MGDVRSVTWFVYPPFLFGPAEEQELAAGPARGWLSGNEGPGRGPSTVCFSGDGWRKKRNQSMTRFLQSILGRELLFALLQPPHTCIPACRAASVTVLDEQGQARARSRKRAAKSTDSLLPTTPGTWTAGSVPAERRPPRAWMPARRQARLTGGTARCVAQQWPDFQPAWPGNWALPQLTPRPVLGLSG